MYKTDYKYYNSSYPTRQNAYVIYDTYTYETTEVIPEGSETPESVEVKTLKSSVYYATYSYGATFAANTSKNYWYKLNESTMVWGSSSQTAPSNWDKSYFD